MRLRYLIEGRANPANPATVATLATHDPRKLSTVAEVATVAASGEPELWLVKLRAGGLAGLDPGRWAQAADALEELLQSGVVEEALRLGWHPLEIIGVQVAQPHDHPCRAGLIFSLKPGDSVQSVGLTGCVIAYGNVRHIWRRVTLPRNRSIVLPWELPESMS